MGDRSSRRLAALLVGLAALTSTAGTALARAPAVAHRPVWVIEHGWHTSVAVRQADVSQDLWPESRDPGVFGHVEVSWGDGDFYPAARGTLGLALQAAFASRSSVLYVTAFDAPPPERYPGSAVVLLHVTGDGLDGLARFVHQHYARDPSTGMPIVAAPGFEPVSRFYLARGRYRLCSNSNHWTARALRAAGVPVLVGLAFNSGSVLAQAAEHGRLRPRPAP